MTSPHTNPLGVEWFGLSMGLGFVLSFGYWCTDFLVIQRAMAADSEECGAARPADRGDSQDVLPVPRDSARPDRDCYSRVHATAIDAGTRGTSASRSQR